MNYALIEDGVVTNIVWLYETNTREFPNAVRLGERRVEIGDSYEDGCFFRNGIQVLTDAEAAQIAALQYEEALRVLGVNTEEEVSEDAQ